MAHYTILGKDPYWMNFIGLMVLTLIEVVAVGFHLPDERIFIFSNYTLMILTVVAIPKFIMIALIFMHLGTRTTCRMCQYVVIFVLRDKLGRIGRCLLAP